MYFPFFPPFFPPPFFPSAQALLQADRTLWAPRVPNYSCCRRILRPIDFEGNVITMADLRDFAHRPLERVVEGKRLDDYVVDKGRDDEGGWW